MNPVRENLIPQALVTGVVRDTTGEGGGAVVSVSQGLVVLTPGAPVPVFVDPGEFVEEMRLFLLEIGAEETPVLAEINGTPVPTLDPASLPLPEGLSLYTNLSDLDISGVDPSGESMSYILFRSSDLPEQVFNFYLSQLEVAGYNSLDIKAPDEEGVYDGSWMKSGLILTVTVTPGNDGRCQVMLAWMSL